MSVQQSDLIDPALATEVDLARAAAQEEAGDERVGEYVAYHVEDEAAVTHLFEADKPGYRGWRWAVTLTSAGPATDITVSEVVLLPGPSALVAPDWIPWQNRVQAGDLGVGDLLPTDPDDPRLVPAYLQSDDPVVEETATEAGLGRVRVMSRPARYDAAERWHQSEFGPRSDMARSAPAHCGTCGFYLPLAGSLRAAFGTCGNELSPADAHVVHAEYGCGAHSEAAVEQVSPVLVADLIYDDAQLDVEPLTVVDEIPPPAEAVTPTTAEAPATEPTTQPAPPPEPKTAEATAAPETATELAKTAQPQSATDIRPVDDPQADSTTTAAEDFLLPTAWVEEPEPAPAGPVITSAEDAAPAEVEPVVRLESKVADPVAPHQPSEPALAPEQAVAPEAVSAPEQAAAPEAVTASESADVPEAALAPEPAAAPEAVSAPESAAAPEAVSASESADVPEAALAPEPAAAPEAISAPEPAAPEAASAPESPATPEAVSAPEPAAAPEAALASEEAVAEAGPTTAVEFPPTARGEGWVPLGQVFRPVGDSPLRPRPGIPTGMEPRRMPSFSIRVPRGLGRRTFGPGRRNPSAGD